MIRTIVVEIKLEGFVCRWWWWLKEKSFALHWHNAYVFRLLLGMTHVSAALLYEDAEASTDFGPRLISHLPQIFVSTVRDIEKYLD